MTTARWTIGIASVMAGVAWGVMAAQQTTAAPGGPSAVPVIVELFTSEGCSSCPPADDLLTKLIAAQPVAGARVIGLSEHVDYWDRLGWRDPFSSAQFSARQSQYAAKAFHTDGIFTPQMVVAGQKQFVGSDAGAARDAIAVAARKRPTVSLTLKETGVESPDAISVEVHAEPSADARIDRATEVLIAIVEDDLATDVQRGENGGRRLRHNGVVRRLAAVGDLSAPSSSLTTTSTTPLKADWRRANIHVVAFAQETESRRVVGAALLDRLR